MPTDTTNHEPPNTPDLREAVKASIAQHRRELCEALGEEPSAEEWTALLDEVRDLANHPVIGGCRDWRNAREKRRRELADALGYNNAEPETWSNLIAKVRDLAVTDCAPASQAEQMLWQVCQDLGVEQTSWTEALEAIRELAKFAPGAAKRDAAPEPMDHGMAPVRAELAKLREREPEIPRGRVVVDAQGLASLRADLTELRLFMTERTLGFTESRGAMASLRADLTALAERLKALESDTENHARCLDVGEWRAAMKAHEAELTTLDKRLRKLGEDAGDADDRLKSLLDALRSDHYERLRKLASDLDLVRQRLGDDPQPAHDRITDLTSELRGLAKLVEPGARIETPDPEAELRAVRPLSRIDEAPLDLATLRVPCAEDPNTDYAHIDGPYLDVRNVVDGRHGTLALTVDSARLLARALTQWADSQKGAGK